MKNFGGNWTVEKLDILSNYYNAYLKALKNFNFTKIYIDAFAGSGKIQTSNGKLTIKGSARLVLECDNKFDRYYFIEAKKKNCEELNNMIESDFFDIKDKITIIHGDANEKLIDIIKHTNRDNTRAILFIDPYATQFSWSSLESVAKTGSIDVWYLFPFHAVNRMLKKEADFEQKWVSCLNRVFGDENWRTRFYEQNRMISLFDEDMPDVKTTKVEDIKDYIIERLETVFPKVSHYPRILRNNNNSPLFIFCFAVSSTKKRAQNLALKIADYILKEKIQ